jgi:hypothetical protein
VADLPNTPGSAPSRLLYTTDETAEILHMSRRWLLDSGIPVVRCGRSLRFHIRDIEAYIAAHKTPAASSSGNIDVRSLHHEAAGCELDSTTEPDSGGAL